MLPLLKGTNMPAAPRSNMKAAKICWNIIGVPDSMRKYSQRIKPKKNLPQFMDSFTKKPE